jgi:hypothetical protein
MLHLVGVSAESSTMHGSMNIKFINAKQTIDIHAYKNTKRKLYKTNAAIWFNKTCRGKELTPNYIKKIHFPLSLGNGQSPHVYINQRLQIQFRAPDDERCAARNMLSRQKTLQ